MTCNIVKAPLRKHCRRCFIGPSGKVILKTKRRIEQAIGASFEFEEYREGFMMVLPEGIDSYRRRKAEQLFFRAIEKARTAGMSMKPQKKCFYRNHVRGNIVKVCEAAKTLMKQCHMNKIIHLMTQASGIAGWRVNDAPNGFKLFVPRYATSEQVELALFQLNKAANEAEKKALPRKASPVTIMNVPTEDIRATSPWFSKQNICTEEGSFTYIASPWTMPVLIQPMN